MITRRLLLNWLVGAAVAIPLGSSASTDADAQPRPEHRRHAPVVQEALPRRGDGSVGHGPVAGSSGCRAVGSGALAAGSAQGNERGSSEPVPEPRRLER
ncbi:hypothetical protein FHR70_004614 [Microvirga lupini]|uniref:Secreted protein n=1 Tax=Microvirga lupini TaxID=420324 RepID=A0A7W4VQL0_9HYPH|nr:hypothetical protein [Microvirga lupini]